MSYGENNEVQVFYFLLFYSSQEILPPCMENCKGEVDM